MCEFFETLEKYFCMYIVLRSVSNMYMSGLPQKMFWKVKDKEHEITDFNFKTFSS